MRISSPFPCVVLLFSIMPWLKPLCSCSLAISMITLRKSLAIGVDDPAPRGVGVRERLILALVEVGEDHDHPECVGRLNETRDPLIHDPFRDPSR
jgi:hypothetical protein